MHEHYSDPADREKQEIYISAEAMLDELEAAKRHVGELSEVAAVCNQWRPDVCPITGRPFFMWIEHPTLGNVPTYGGPLDSYTIPTKDGDGEFSCERYDHDFGDWVDSECLGLYLIDDEEQCRIYDLEERVKELEARDIQPEETQFIAEAIGAHAYIVGCLQQNRPDLALEESLKWVQVVERVAEIAVGTRVKGE
ncbi:ead/Ea22-like family protein [Escherichia coli]|nr:ead/Ea22-like family protein [Escherichia coli]